MSTTKQSGHAIRFQKYDSADFGALRAGCGAIAILRVTVTVPEKMHSKHAWSCGNDVCLPFAVTRTWREKSGFNSKKTFVDPMSGAHESVLRTMPFTSSLVVLSEIGLLL